MLVVDDSRFVRASLVRALAPRFRIQQAESGERAWELLLLDPSIGAVLSDLNMPGVDGFELLRRVRGSMLERVRTVPFAVLSGADDPAQRDRARELGADRFVVKGDGVESLGDWLASHLVPGAGASGLASPSAQAPTHAPSAVAPTRPPSAAAFASDGERPSPRIDATPPEGRGSIPMATTPASALAAQPWAPDPSAPAAPDPLRSWLDAAVARSAAGAAPAADAPPVLLRLHAPGLDALPARLRRGVRSADALHLEGADTAWLCVPASEALALRLALRFGLLAAGRQALESGPAAARVAVCLQGIDPERAADALAALRALPPDIPAEPGLSVHVLAGPGGEGAGWRCALPWPAARLLIA